MKSYLNSDNKELLLLIALIPQITARAAERMKIGTEHLTGDERRKLNTAGTYLFNVFSSITARLDEKTCKTLRKQLDANELRMVPKRTAHSERSALDEDGLFTIAEYAINTCNICKISNHTECPLYGALTDANIPLAREPCNGCPYRVED